MEKEKTIDKLPVQQFKINFVSVLNDMEIINRTTKLSVVTAIFRYAAILQ